MALVIVPVKPLLRAKRRLSQALSEAERRALCLAMLADVCCAARGGGEVWVVTSDEDASAVAEAAGAAVRGDPTPAAGLNPSLERVIPPGTDGVLVLSSDLPAVAEEDVRAIGHGPGVALAPDRAGTGTNALWRSPGNAIPLAFGEGSRAAHERLSRERGVPFRLVARAGLALDVDTPADLAAAWDSPVGPATRAALRDLGFPERTRRLA